MSLFFVTGTQVYGPATEKSDLDIVLEPQEAHSLNLFLREKGIAVSYTLSNLEDYAGYYFTLDGFLKVNIIVAGTPKKAEAWQYATDRMKKLNPIPDRKERLKSFRAFVAHIADKED